MRAWAAATGHGWTVNAESSWAYVPLVCKSENGRHLQQLEESGEVCFKGCLEGEARVLNENAIARYQLELGMDMLRSKTRPSHSL
jgi:hypothetical protein